MLLWFCDVVDDEIRNVADLAEAIRLADDRTYAGYSWWLVAADTAEMAFERGVQLIVGRHPGQPEYETVHALIRVGIDPSLEPLMENQPCPRPRTAPLLTVPR